MWNKQWAVIIGITTIVLVMCFSLTAFNNDDHNMANNTDIADIESAVCGVFETQAQMGMFTSSDGLTTSLTDSEIEKLISDYNRKVDLYYSKDHPSNVYY